MEKSVMQMADEILANNPTTGDDAPMSEDALPDISDEQRELLISESVSVTEQDAKSNLEADLGQAAAEERVKAAQKRRDRKKAARMSQGTRQEKEAGLPAGAHEKSIRDMAAAHSRGQRNIQRVGQQSRARSKASLTKTEAYDSASMEKELKAHKDKLRAKTAQERYQAALRRWKSGERGGLKPPQLSDFTSEPKTDTASLKHEGGVIADAKDDKWIQGAEADIERRGTKGKCTPITKPGCTGRALALAKTFKKMAKKKDRSVKSKKEKAAENASLTRKQLAILLEARDILREVSTVGMVGVTGSRAYDNDGPEYDGGDKPKIQPVDKSLRKTSKTTKAKKAKKKTKVRKETFDLFLSRVIDTVQEPD